MNRKETTNLLPIIQAFSEGRTIEYRTKNWEYNKGWKYATDWEETEELIFRDTFEYRIKSEPTYRPFKDSEECWNEMQKHQPVGFMKFKDTENGYYMLTSIAEGVGVGINDSLFSYDRIFDDYTFADGTPFGVKVEG